jgi:anti-sigma B factor antagonist
MRLADLHFESRDGLVIARVVGEIDMSNAGELATALTDATPNEALGIVLDLSDIDYVDSAGIHLLYRLRESLRARGQSLTLVVPAHSAVLDALRLAGIERNLDVVPTVEDAVHAALGNGDAAGEATSGPPNGS